MNYLLLGKTEVLDLDFFRPFLAWMHQWSYTHPALPLHFSLHHRIINNCNPDVPPVSILEVGEGRLVVVDDRPPPLYAYPTPNVLDWWPMAQTNIVAGKLQRRIQFSGHVLPILTAMAGALMSEIYTTTSAAGSARRRFRLQYLSSPITDFGICLGRARVVAEDRLMFYSMKSKKFSMLPQDPNEHYWMYFTTVKGEEIFFDGAFYPFNLAQVILTEGYGPPPVTNVLFRSPCTWTAREIKKKVDGLYDERSRVSILRNEKLQKVMEHHSDRFDGDDIAVFFALMEEFAGKKLAKTEKQLFYIWLKQNCLSLGTTLDQRLFRNWPKEPRELIERDPNESTDGMTWGR
ncbi:hypothetical protein EIP91_002862 [Steccherinum ochraceum]|uniref:Uncharacterized protein n=1 Tax=Steccherinum ochraceum TaxID=92696 RepID=A0A4V2MXL1_9APHY|nr:hypothetical protein EIP91_002862 [Steccherinum ochraceum]